jgi:hypothetical protein
VLALGFDLLLKGQAAFGLTAIRAGFFFYPDATAGRELLPRLFQFCVDPLGFAPCIGEFFARRLRGQLIG